MSCSSKTWLIDRFLNILLDKNICNEMFTLSGLQSAAIRPDSVFRTWNFVKEYWDTLYSRL